MQIRELSLKELYEAYALVKLLYEEMEYETFEDRIYEMKERYRMLGVFDKGELRAYAGVDVMTTLKDGRHIRVHDFVALDARSKSELKSYLEDYARIAAARKVLYGC